MFGKRSDEAINKPAVLPPPTSGGATSVGTPPAGAIPDLPMPPGSGYGGQTVRAQPEGSAQARPAVGGRKSENYYDIKSTIFNALIDAIDLTQLGQLDRGAARDEIRDIVNEIITLKDVVMSIAEQEELLEDICNDVLGYGPLEP